MKELKILGVVIFFTLVVYIGVEPFAHSQMHHKVAPADFSFKDLTPNKKVGDITRGKELVMGAGACTGCHSIKSIGIKAPMDDATASASYGVVPPDLSNIGYLYDENFLSALIKDPKVALKVEHKFKDRSFPMSSFAGAGGDIDQEIADMVSYFKSIAPKQMSDKEVFVDACGRCHSMKYDKFTRVSDSKSLQNYLGSNPPDLSIAIRWKSKEYLETFINKPQAQLHVTAMPRVGLKEAPQEQIINYFESVGDSKKAERESLIPKIIGFFIIFTILAYLWKKSIWRDLH